MNNGSAVSIGSMAASAIAFHQGSYTAGYVFFLFGVMFFLASLASIIYLSRNEIKSKKNEETLKPAGFLTPSNAASLSKGLGGVMTVSTEKNAHFSTPLYVSEKA
jgi:hypothetical protein